MVEPHPIPKHPAFIDLTGRKMESGVQVVHFLGRKQWLAICPCGREFPAGGAYLLKGISFRCPTCRAPREKPETETCRACGRTLPFTSEFFAGNKQHPFGLRVRCRDCLRPVQRADANRDAATLRMKILRHYSGNGLFPGCECCGETIWEFLSIDHIDGGGSEHRRRCRNQAGLYRDIIRCGFPKGLRVLCHNCNSCLRAYGFCAHDPERIRTKSIYTRPDRILAVPTDFSGQLQDCIKCSRQLPMTSDFFSKHSMMGSGLLRMCKDCQSVYQRGQRKQLKEKQKHLIFSHYSAGEPRCACCGITDTHFLSIDHIDGGGSEEREGISHFYKWVIDSGFPTHLQVLCYSCNLAKGFNGSCPHELYRRNSL